jgi:Pentatricopeptide repeat domain/PPR repeat
MMTKHITIAAATITTTKGSSIGMMKMMTSLTLLMIMLTMMSSCCVVVVVALVNNDQPTWSSITAPQKSQRNIFPLMTKTATATATKGRTGGHGRKWITTSTTTELYSVPTAAAASSAVKSDADITNISGIDVDNADINDDDIDTDAATTTVTTSIDDHEMMNRWTDRLLTEDVETLIMEDIPVLDVLRYWHKQQSQSQGGNNINGALTAQRILDRCTSIEFMDTSSYDVDGPLQMHTGHYTLCIDAWAKSGHPSAPSKANELIKRMDEHGIALNRVTWNVWIRSQSMMTSSSAVDGGGGSGGNSASACCRRVEQLLQDMENDVGPYMMQINDYNNLLGVYAKQGKALEAERLVKDLVDRYNDGSISCRPDLCSYNSLMDAWANADSTTTTQHGTTGGGSSNGVRAEMILDEIERRSDEHQWRKPDTRTYVPAMRAVARSGEDNIMERVLAIKDRAISNGVTPNAYMLSTLLDAYATADPKGGLDNLDEILSMTDQLLTQEEGTIGGNNNEGGMAAICNSALKLFTKCINNSDEKEEALTKAEELFSRMKSEGTVDAVSYSTMITLYANSNEGDKHKSAMKVEELLTSINTDPRLGPNSIVQNAAMNAFVQLGMTSKATELLYRMEQSYRDGGPLVPSTVSYGTMISAWSKSADENRVRRAEETFERMVDMYKSGNVDAEPNFITNVVLVDTIVKSGQDGSADRAEKIVRIMYDSYRRGESNIKPNTQLVTTVIDCWCRSGDQDAGERAETLLNWLIDIYNEQDMDKSLMPNEFAFAATISAWARSRKFGKASRAKAILDRMTSLSEAGVVTSTPNAYCYTSVINACAYCINDSLEKRDSLQIFIDVYKRMNKAENMEYSDLTFSTVLLALRNLLQPGEKRTAAVKTVFKKITEEGLCSETVLYRLRALLDNDEMRNLLGKDVIIVDGMVDVNSLPSDWTRNVRKNDTRKRTPRMTQTNSTPTAKSKPAVQNRFRP